MIITNQHNLPEAYYKNCIRLFGKHPKMAENEFSATELLKGTKEIVLMRRYGDAIEVDCMDLFFAIDGLSFHSLMEGDEKDNELSEGRLEASFELSDGTTFNVSGGFDLWNEAERLVTDYKNSKMYSVQKALDGSDLKWRNQLRIYWLLLNKAGFPTKYGKIVASMKDWSKNMANRKADYPKNPIATINYEFNAVDDYVEATQQITEKLEEIHRYWNEPDDKIPECTSDERWEADEKWAVMKQGRKTAIKLFDTQEGAENYVESSRFSEEKDADKLYVEHRPGVPTKCINYCYCNKQCSFYRSYMRNLEKQDTQEVVA